MSLSSGRLYRQLAWWALVNVVAVVAVEVVGHWPGFFAAGAWGEAGVCLLASIVYAWLAVAAVRLRAREGPMLLAVGLIAANWVGLALLDWLI